MAAVTVPVTLWAAIVHSSFVHGIFRDKDAAGFCARQHAEACTANILEDMSPEDGSAAMEALAELDIFAEGAPLPYGEGLNFALQAVVADGVDISPHATVWASVNVATDEGSMASQPIASTRVFVFSSKEAAEAHVPPPGWRNLFHVKKSVVDKEAELF